MQYIHALLYHTLHVIELATQGDSAVHGGHKQTVAAVQLHWNPSLGTRAYIVLILLMYLLIYFTNAF